MIAGAVRCCGAILLGALGLVAVGQIPAWGATTTVDCNTASLQTAINAASSGDVLLVSGTCAGTFTLSQAITLTLQGAGGGAVLDGASSGTVLTVSAGSLTVDNITIKNGLGASGGNGSNGGLFSDGGNGGNGAPGGVLVASGATLTFSHSAVVQNQGGSGGNGGNGGFAACVSATNGGEGGIGAAGGIENDGTLIVDHLVVTQNTGGAGGSGGTGDGSNGGGGDAGFAGPGGIDDFGTLTVTASTVSQDTGGSGGAGGAGGSCLGTIPTAGADSNGGVGGIESDGTETIDSSAITADTGGPGGGSQGTQGDGGIGVLLGQSLTVTNSTIAGDRGGTAGGINDQELTFLGQATTTLRYDTISGNTGAVTGGLFDSEGSATLTATILAGNTGPDTADADCSEDPDTSTLNPLSGGYNVIGVGDGCFFPTARTDAVGTAASPVNADLGALAANGGPTQTMAPSWNSPAVDAIPVGVTDASGAALCPPSGTADQRGVARPQGPACDVGAFELDDPITATGTPLTPVEGKPLSGTQVAAFSGPDPSAQASDYTAKIDWGDGSTSAGTVSAGSASGSFLVDGSHTYAEEGSYLVTVTVTSTITSAVVATATAAATVADAPLTATGVSAPAGQSFSGPVATFTDANSGAPASDFTAAIAWGDGSTSPGTVTGTGGSYTVRGSHAYASTGSFSVTVTIADDGGSGATAATTLLAYAVTSGGNFVIGDQNAAAGSHVTFWAPGWPKVNSLSGGSAPAAFKGLATAPPGAPACGTSWSINIGAAITPPPAPLPSYIAVIVSGKITKSGSVISGNAPHVVIVKTNPGYQPSPISPGTGTVISQIC